MGLFDNAREEDAADSYWRSSVDTTPGVFNLEQALEYIRNQTDDSPVMYVMFVSPEEAKRRYGNGTDHT